ncbi:hypothetical protein ACFV1L_07380 [Kitasatospora sp. NPDC059646]|uniref:hypothetical protein n=1 Tax=Kitasatospora sp. NPDC059646 TaxID=3346893 RepID=UPI0036BF4885
MHHPRSRALAVSAAFTALALGAFAAPAQAADHQLKLEVPASVQIPSTPKAPGQWDENLSVRYGRTGTGILDGLKLTFDTKDLAGVAQLTVGGCATSGTLITCNVDHLQYESINFTGHPWLSAVAGAKPGSSGVLHLRFSGAGATEATQDVRVDVGGPRFKLKDVPPVKGARPGDTVTPSVVFANRGETAASKVFVEVTAVSGLNPVQVPANCEYQDNPDGAYGEKSWPGSVNMACAVDAAVGAGEVYKLSPVSFKVAPTAEYTFADIAVFPTADADNSQAALWRANGPLKRGTGPALTLAKTTDADLLGAPLNGYDHRIEQEVIADNPADFSASAAWAPANGGRTGTLTVVEANSGPASIFDRSGGEATPHLSTVLPAGVSVTKVPAGCGAVEWENGQHVEHPNKYSCEGPFWVPSGYLRSYDFELKVDDPAAAAKAVVSLQNTVSANEPGHPSAVMSWDHNPANDRIEVALGTTAGGGLPTATAKPTTTATATVAPPVVQPTGSASARPSGSGAPSASASRTSGGGLAFTGSEGTGTMVGLGVGAIVLGGGVIALVARRRRGAHG